MIVLILLAIVLPATYSRSSDNIHPHVKNPVENIGKEFSRAMIKYKGEEHYRALVKRGKNSQEMKERKESFINARQTINDVNSDPTTAFTCGDNELSVQTEAEWKRRLNLNLTELEELNKRAELISLRNVNPLPKRRDWVSRGGVTEPRNQGSCGSCWAFAAVSVLETRYYVKTGKLVSFSDQEYVDCLGEFKQKHFPQWYKVDTNGCNGGIMTFAWDYNKINDRMASLKDLQYVAKDRYCDKNNLPKNAMKDAKVTGNYRVSEEDKTDLGMRKALEFGAVATGMTTSSPFQQYREGIFSCKSPTCDCSARANHAVTLTGYEESYWMVRNSWGSKWGDGGYIKMSREQDNICGLFGNIMYPKLECREGRDCPGYPEDEVDDGEADENDTPDIDVGEEVECGEIQHFGGLCLDLDDTAEKWVVLTTEGCTRDICLTEKEYLQDKATRACLTTVGGKLKFDRCERSEKWTKSKGGFKSLKDNKYLRPNGDQTNPVEDTKVVKGKGRPGNAIKFEIKEQMCWEEFSDVKLKKIIKSGGDSLTRDSLEDAQELCVEETNCKGIWYSKKDKKYYLGTKTKTKKSKGDKVFVVEPCSETCDAGTQRCDDGVCRERCSDEDEDCPAGTTRCPDGVCKHVHMC